MKEKSFEESLLSLEEIIRELESGEVALDDMVKKYEEATDLVKFCSEKLEKATKTVNKIVNKDAKVEEFKVEE